MLLRNRGGEIVKKSESGICRQHDGKIHDIQKKYGIG